MTREALARHFHALTSITRHDLFGAQEAEFRPVHLKDDAETMFAGYVGPEYKPGIGTLILAINPGGGGDAYQRRIPEDEVLYPLLHAFKRSEGLGVVSAFEDVNGAFAAIVKRWNLWRILGPTIDAAGRDLREVAYMNVVPYRTRQDKMPPTAVRRVSWDRIVAPTLKVLRPAAVVALGKKADSVIRALGSVGARYYCVPRTIGDSYISDDARQVHEKMRSDLRRP